jgi:hypothetical protein
MKHISLEVEKVETQQSRDKSHLEKRQGDQHAFLSEIKDELDRLSERVRLNFTE